ncbi:MAG TPA: PAS domain S-box protein [Lacunisphaera sp.]|jgi:PAS domain S-box-containing protein
MTLPADPSVNAISADALLASIVDSSDDAILSKNLDGTVTSWNRGAERIFGYTREEAIGGPSTLLLPEDRLLEEEGILARVKKGEQVEHFETKRKAKNGKIIDVAVTISPIRNREGIIVGVSKVARDISGQKTADRAGSLLASIVSSSEDAIVSKNLNGIITSWNSAAEKIFGYTPEEAIGQSVLMLVPQDRKEEEPKILARMQRGERMEHFETIRVRKNGEHFPVSLTISPVRDHSGTIVGASKIARDITELKRISDDREQLLASERSARAAAEHANRMKDDFLATISHELRTPLNAIVGWTQVLKESGSLTADDKSGVETIERNARVQAQLIDDLLDLGRIVSGKMTLDVERFDLGLVVSDAVASVHHAAEVKQIRIKKVIDSISSMTMGDRKRLQQVIWNLLSNAIKFSPKGGTVIITLSRINSHVEITVSDNGRGIDADFLPHVFERFRQADASTTRKHGGLGIGLAIVKQLVEMHGGHVSAESPGLDKGATFTVSLPVVVAHAPEIRQAPHATAPATDEHAASENLAGIKVLAVDDDADSLGVVQRVLSSRNAEVKTASSVGDALTIFRTFHPDIVLSDIGMPGRDGYDFIRTLRATPDGKSIPAAALTALARSEDRMRALNAGYQTHVSKPVAPAELIAVVRSLVSLR